MSKKFAWAVLVLVTVALIAAGCGGTTAKKDAFPTTNINGTIAWGAGGGTDNVMRTLAPIAEKQLGKSIVLSNKPGAAGAIATQYVYDQKADGYNLLMNAENPQLYQILGLSKLSYNDFEPILLAVQGSTVIVVPKDSPYKTLDDLLKAAKANPGKLTIGISGVGGQPYVTAAILKKVEGVTFNPVTFDGDGPLVTALLGKQLDVTGLAVGAATQYIKNGDLRALAVMATKQNPAIPEVPAITQLNPAYQDVLKASGFFYGVWVKKGTPEDVIKKLTDAYMVAYKDPKFQEYAQKNGLTLMGLTDKEAKDFAAQWQSQMAWLIYEAGGAKESPEKFNIPKPAK
ncbi:MAG: tripartite tricarboxylate transporter substrate binding protein [Negativicutes bacterium]|nr:tripartite tricarboxylate transporter substrate binding protein [Negativicutes bacterium]